MSDRLSKLLRYALDPAAGEGEAVNAATRFIEEARREGLDLSGVARVIAPPDVPKKTKVRKIVVYKVPPQSMVFPFGRYAGESLASVYSRDPQYVTWFCENVRRSPAVATLIRAARQVVAESKVTQ